MKLNQALVKEFKNKTILITGGAGSVGSAVVKRLLDYPVKQIRVIDTDEHSLFTLNRSLKNKKVRYLLGDILDSERIEMAGYNTDIVIHLAAIKNIEVTEYNPIETVNTNINGTINMIKMVTKNKPKKFLNISTDKAVEASTLYGSTKHLGERLISWAGIHLNPPTKFATARFGNVMETRGNVFEVWNDENNKNKPLSITHPSMERYFFHLNEAVEFVLACIPLINKGEIFVPKMKSFIVKDMANKISKKHKIIGLREGEKMKEILMTKKEEENSIEKKNLWIINNKNSKFA
jgi:UDP-N-acetylglucosamine 4,6-dehydratase/5-epimerase